MGVARREDAVGNIFGRFEGTDPTAGSVLTGSHCDAIPLAGEILFGSPTTSTLPGPDLSPILLPLLPSARPVSEGMYDGTLGVIGGIEARGALKAAVRVREQSQGGCSVSIGVPIQCE